MVGTGALDLNIGWRLKTAPLCPFLQGGLGIGQLRLILGQVLSEETLDEFVGAAQAAIEIDGSDHSFRDVGKDSIFFGATGTRFALAQNEVGAEIELAGDQCAGFLADKGIQRARQLAFVGLGQTTKPSTRSPRNSRRW
jgi:hypothetical protein